MATPEGKVKALLRKVLKPFGVWMYAPVSNGMGAHGIPDYVCCVPLVVTPDMVGKKLGLFVGIETKAPGRRGQPDRGLSKMQVMQKKRIMDASGYYFVVDGMDDIEDLTVYLRLGDKNG